MKIQMALLTILVAAYMSGRYAEACSCADSGLPCEAYNHADAIFLGVATSVSNIQVATGVPGEFTLAVVAQFKIEKSFKGDLSGMTSVYTGNGGGDCGFPFLQNEAYLIYAHKAEDGRLGTSICSRTRILREAAEDLKFLGGLAGEDPGGRAFGTLRRVQPSPGQQKINLNPLSGVLILLEGPNQRFEVVTGPDGTYHAEFLPPGRYVVRAQFTDSLAAESRDIELFEHGCARADLYARENNVLEGRITDESGKRIQGVVVQIMPAENGRRSAYPSDFMYEHQYVASDESGDYKLGMIPAGKYFLGVNIDRYSLPSPHSPYPRTYYSRSDGQATIIEIGGGSRLTGYDLVMPHRYKEREIRGVVLQEDGPPAIGAKVYFFTSDYENLVVGGVADGQGSFLYADEKGQFQLSLLQEMDYWVLSKDRGNFMHSEPVSVKVGQDQQIQLLLDKSGPFNLELLREQAQKKP